MAQISATSYASAQRMICACNFAANEKRRILRKTLKNKGKRVNCAALQKSGFWLLTWENHGPITGLLIEGGNATTDTDTKQLEIDRAPLCRGI